MLWLALHFPDLPLEVLVRGMESVPPLVVREGTTVLLASAAAQNAGIHPGMRLATASSLSDRLQVLPRNPAREERALRLLAGRLLSFSPQVSMQPPDGLVLEVGGSLRLFRGLSPLLEQLLESLRESGFSSAPALGPTPLAAWQLTCLPLEKSRTCAGHEDGFPKLLADLPLQSLRLPEKLRHKLTAPGFATLGDLLSLPRQSLGRRYGRDFLLWLEKLLGERPDPREPLRPPERFVGEIEFPDPVENCAGLVFPMQRLLEDLSDHLRRHQQSVTAIRWHFRPLDGDTEQLVIRRARPSHEAADWLMLTRRRLEHHRLRAPVLELMLDTERPQRRAVEAAALFRDPSARPDRALLLEKLATLPGLTCYSPREEDEPLPEAGERQHAPLRAPANRAPADAPFSQPPLWLLEPPRPLDFRNGQPQWMNQPLEWLPGEERFSSHWWQPDNHVREYHIARHPSGACCWVFRERRSGRWFLQGLF